MNNDTPSANDPMTHNPQLKILRKKKKLLKNE